jgi:hypothetical protein
MSTATIKSLDIKKLLKKGVTNKYDDIKYASELVQNEYNVEMYGEYDDNHISNIMASIKEEGLIQPIVLFSDGKTIKSGHNRLIALLKLGYVKVPVIITNTTVPKSKLESMKMVAIENMGRPESMSRSYNSVEVMCEAFSEENDGIMPKAKDIESFCALHRISYNSYRELKQLYLHHPDLFDNVLSGKQSLKSAISDAQMRANNITALSKTPFMNGLIGEGEMNYALSVITSVKNQIDMIEVIKPGGIVGKAFEEIQKNTMGGIVHELATNAIRDVVNYIKGKEILTAPKNNNLYDLQAVNHNSGIETKTCVTEAGKKPKWVTHRYKDGYILLLSLTPNGKRAFAGYGVVSADCWSKQKPVGTLNINKLYEQKDFNVIIGSLEVENGKVVVNHDKIII